MTDPRNDDLGTVWTSDVPPSKQRRATQRTHRHYYEVGEAYLAGGNSTNPQRRPHADDAKAVSYAEADEKHYYLLELYGPQDDGPQPTRRGRTS